MEEKLAGAARCEDKLQAAVQVKQVDEAATAQEGAARSQKPGRMGRGGREGKTQ